MAETTSDRTEMTRSETAELLRSIADELDADGQRVGIPVGNKEVQLSPPETIDVESTVTERSRRLRKDTEELALTFKWNVTEDAESASDSDADSEQEGGTESTIDPEPGR